MGLGLRKERNSARRASNSLAGVRGRMEGLGAIAMHVIPCICSWVRVSTRRVCFMSTRRLKWRRKSAPRMGHSTSARMKTQ